MAYCIFFYKSVIVSLFYVCFGLVCWMDEKVGLVDDYLFKMVIVLYCGIRLFSGKEVYVFFYFFVGLYMFESIVV